MNASSPRPRHRPGVVPIVSASLLAAVVLGGCAAADDLTAADAAQEAPAGAVQQHAEAVPEDRAGEAADLVAEPGERAVAHTASMSVTVADVDAAVADAKEWVRGAGGYVAAESVDSAAGQNPTAHLTLRVPADSYEEALEEFAALGDRQYLEQRAQDVTEEVADVDSRVASAEASLERLRELLEEAGEVGEILEIEEQISSRQADLEALQARQRVLAGTTSYATVELALSLPSSAVPPSDDDSPGFLGGLAAGWRALLTVLDVAVVAVGWLLPFVAASAVVAAPLVWLGLRRRARSGTGAAEAESGPSTGAGADTSAAAPAESERD